MKAINILSIALVLILVSCSKRKATSVNYISSKTLAETSTAPEGITCYDEQDKLLFSAPLASSGKIVLKDKSLDFKPNSSGDKIKFYDQDGREAFHIKIKPDSWKLRTPDSQLIFKVKTSSDKLKVSTQEDMSESVEWKLKNGKFYQGDKEFTPKEDGLFTVLADKKISKLNNYLSLSLLLDRRMQLAHSSALLIVMNQQ